MSNKNDGTIVTTIGSYEIRENDKGYFVQNTESKAKSTLMTSKRVAYHVARQAKKSGDDELGKVQEAIDHIKSAVGTGKKRNPVKSIESTIARLKERKVKLAEALAKVEDDLKSKQSEQKRVKAEAKKLAEERRKQLQEELKSLEQ